MLAPDPRGPISSLVLSWLREDAEPSLPAADAELAAAGRNRNPVYDEDKQIALWTLYELHYGGFSNVDDRWEWSPKTLHVRRCLESEFETALRRSVRRLATGVCEGEGDLATRLFDLATFTDSPPLSAYLQRRATREQMLEFLMHRSVYHLKEADPHSWAIPRLVGAPKAALVEIQYDEYGAGRPDRVHAAMFGQALQSCGLDHRYGTYIEQVPAVTLAVNNAMSLFGLHRRLRAAAMGHLAAFESTSSLPAHRISRGLRRLEFPDVAAAYYDEHVEADAVHEQLAVRSICVSMAEEDPSLIADLAFGAAACLYLDDAAASFLLDRWSSGLSALRLEVERASSVTGA